MSRAVWSATFSKLALSCFQAGQGARMKLVVNMIMGSMMASLAEGFSLAERSGLAKQDLLDVVALGAIANPMFSLKVRRISSEQDFPCPRVLRAWP
jgi:3-hydroxyisobutyrate dehydrogenase-like beta-hydroxyacid dehydrogenase